MKEEKKQKGGKEGRGTKSNSLDEKRIERNKPLPSPQTMKKTGSSESKMMKVDPTDKIAELEQRIKALEEGMAQTLQALQNINKFFEQIQKQKEEATATNNPIPQTQTQVPQVPQFDLESLAPLLQFFLGGGKSELDKLKDKVFLRWLTRKTVYENLVDKMFLRFAKKMLSKEEFEELKKVFEEE